jgi:hypothetical protein
MENKFLLDNIWIAEEIIQCSQEYPKKCFPPHCIQKIITIRKLVQILFAMYCKTAVWVPAPDNKRKERGIFMVTVIIKPFTYRLLQKQPEGGQFKSESYFKDGFYYIDVDDKVYRWLLKIDDDPNLAILGLTVEKKEGEEKIVS